ncbi:hypothetical protein RHOSPDRAFT_31743 [Rhodotorula sp. JG-1b]|nr:hypothetical protein RHOSPDRAFT_31743 [Rhodotorula sp. JG-1b]
MLDALVYRPNTIKQRQAQFQADQRFVFQKVPRARLYMIGFMSLFTVGTAGILNGVYRMALGKKN